MTPLLSLLVLLSPFLSLTTCQLQKDPDFSVTQPFTSGSQPLDTFGSATLHSDTIVLTPHSPPHVIGAVWSKKPNPHVYWEADFTFRVTGAERGGTGLAFWYTAKRGLGGNVFGSVDQWDGLGVFFDANTGGKSTVRGHLNAGDVRYDALPDHVGNAFGSCPFVFRGVPTPLNVKVTNSKDSFKVVIDGKVCFETNQVLLQPGNYFGVSAATGDQPDHHQLFDFKVTPLEATVGSRPNDAPPVAQVGLTAGRERVPPDVILNKLNELSKHMSDWKDENNQVLRRLENAINTISRSIGTISQSMAQLQRDIAKNGDVPGNVEGTLRKMTTELSRLESALKEHMSGHVGILSESLLGRGGFWKGIWLVIGVQAAGWVIYALYRDKQDTGKKLL